MTEEPSLKKRRIHMKDIDIEKYEKTEIGAAPLTHPNVVAKSSRDPNQGLYPRASWKRQQTQQFSEASKVNACSVEVQSSASVSCQFESTSVSKFVSTSKTDPAKFGLAIGFQKASTTMNPVLPFASSQSKTSHGVSSPSSSQGSNLSTTSPGKKGKKSVMRSPIKKGKGSILYYSIPTTPYKETSETTDNKNGIASCKPSNENSSLTEKDIKTRLFEAQNASKLNQNKPSTTKKGKRKKEPKFNRDNAFLYSSGPPQPDPLSMGIKASLIDLTNSDSDESCDSSSDYFERLPAEVTENIFCRLPILDLYLNLPLVCKDWRDMIYSAQFVPWKKRYFRIKMAETLSECEQYKEVIGLMRQHGMSTKPTYLSGLVRYMAGYKKGRFEIATSLERHSKYQWAADLMKERLQGCVKNEVPNPWCVITLLCILSENVSDISEMIDCLLTGKSYLMAVDIIECLYCIATFLLCFKSLKYADVWTHMHYRVYYALYLFENESIYTSSQLRSIFKSSRGQQSLVKYGANREMELTHEQLRIVKFDPEEGAFAKIVAFAGTGKTTTLVRYTKLRPGKRFLLLVFNKSVEQHAKNIFPPNVTCKTGHGLAFRTVGSRYSQMDKNKTQFEKRKFNSSGLKVGKLVQILEARKGISLFVQAKFVMDTLASYMCSADELITTAHVPSTMVGKDGKTTDIDHTMQMKIAEDAECVWERMKDFDDVDAPMTHDGYLKLYQLRKPKLYGYDMILVDEAQDLTPAVLDIISSQTQPKILVGDPNQQIYSFRGAVNAMDLVQATHTFYLTQSFRFGPDIAFVANCALEFFKGEKKRSLVGNAKDSGILGDQDGQLAVITRTNYTLFSEAVKTCCYSNRDEKVAFAGGTDGFGFPMIKAIYALMLPADQRKPEQQNDLAKSWIKGFESMAALEKYATQTQDNELLGKIKIVKVYNHLLPSLISGILKKTVAIQSSADIIFSTAHKAKGLEFSTVKLTDDYNALPNGQVPVGNQRQSKDEANLLYVAVTRAKRRLILTPALITLLDVSGENFLHPVYSKSELCKQQALPDNEANGTTFTCALTTRQFTPCALTLRKHSIKLYDGTSQQGGLLCPQVIREECPSLRDLFGSLRDERSQDSDNSDQTQLQQGAMKDEASSVHFKQFIGHSGYGLGAHHVQFVDINPQDFVFDFHG